MCRSFSSRNTFSLVQYLSGVCLGGSGSWVQSASEYVAVVQVIRVSFPDCLNPEHVCITVWPAVRRWCRRRSLILMIPFSCNLTLIRVTIVAHAAACTFKVQNLDPCAYKLAWTQSILFAYNFHSLAYNLAIAMACKLWQCANNFRSSRSAPHGQSACCNLTSSWVGCHRMPSLLCCTLC